MDMVDNLENQNNHSKHTNQSETHTSSRTRYKNISFLPHLFTLGNAFFGFCAIIFAASGELVAAGYFILMGALMDLLDGRIARFTNTASALGVQLDSLCDAISFGLAPAFLIYTWQLKKLGGIGLIACGLFLLAGIFRLARFNITHTQQSTNFMGTPIPIPGCFLVSILLNMSHTHPKMPFVVFLCLLVLGLAFLMVSKIPFPTFKHVKKHVLAPVGLIFTAIALTMGLTKLLLVVFVGYFIVSFEEMARQNWRRTSNCPKK